MINGILTPFVVPLISGLFNVDSNFMYCLCLLFTMIVFSYRVPVCNVCKGDFEKLYDSLLIFNLFCV